MNTELIYKNIYTSTLEIVISELEEQVRDYENQPDSDDDSDEAYEAYETYEALKREIKKAKGYTRW